VDGISSPKHTIASPLEGGCLPPVSSKDMSRACDSQNRLPAERVGLRSRRTYQRGAVFVVPDPRRVVVVACRCGRGAPIGVAEGS